jgi:hypothetical protein
MATWACLQTVQAYPAGSVQYISSLAVSGPTLVGGSSSLEHSPAEGVGLARDPLHTLWQNTDDFVSGSPWDLETLEPLHTLRQPAGDFVSGLASDCGEVWGTVGQELVVWGRR